MIVETDSGAVEHPSWPGRIEDYGRLVVVAWRIYDCPIPVFAVPAQVHLCHARGLVESQRLLDHLAFGLAIRERLLAEEWTGAPQVREEA
jgi:hypothetical protein